MALEHPSVRSLLGSTDQEILDVVEWVYRGQYEVAPSILPHRCQDQFMAKLHEEWGQHLVRAGLWSGTGKAQSLSRGEGALTAHSSCQARSPSAESRRKEVAKWLRGDSLSRNLWPHSRGCRSRVQQHQSQLPGHQLASEAPPQASTRPQRYTLPSPSPLHPHCADRQLHHSLSKCHLQPQQWESRGGGLAGHGLTVLWCMLQNVPIPCQDQPQSVCPRALQGNSSEDLGDTPPLPADLAHFLGDATDEQIDAACLPALSALEFPEATQQWW